MGPPSFHALGSCDTVETESIVKMPFNKRNAGDLGRLGGRKGGLSRSNEKRRAARRNGRKGGRGASRSLAERLLNRRLTSEEQDLISSELASNRWLLVSESRTLLDFFGVNTSGSAFDPKIWSRKSGRMPREIRHLVGKFRHEANYYLEKIRAKPVPDYAVVKRYPTEEECKDWRRRFPDVNLPPYPPTRKVKEYVRSHPLFAKIVYYLNQYPNITAEQLNEIGGGAFGHPVVPATLKWLRSLGTIALSPRTRPKKEINPLPADPVVHDQDVVAKEPENASSEPKEIDLPEHNIRPADGLRKRFKK